MATFRFRAEAALELRRQQETAAARTLATSEAALRTAEAKVEQAERDRRSAQEQQVQALRHGSDVAAMTWHRDWVARLGLQMAVEQADAARCAGVVSEAEAAWREARRKRLALERMRERAVRRFAAEERRQEMKVIDELARLRFLMADESTRSTS